MELEYCADAIAYYRERIVLVERLNEPKGFAIPGGRRENGESVPECAEREFKEETGLTLMIEGELGMYDAPKRDLRGPKITNVVYGRAVGTIKNEAGKTRVFLIEPNEIEQYKDRFVFDHYQILKDWVSLEGSK